MDIPYGLNVPKPIIRTVARPVPPGTMDLDVSPTGLPQILLIEDSVAVANLVVTRLQEVSSAKFAAALHFRKPVRRSRLSVLLSPSPV